MGLKLLTFDVESSGVDVNKDRILTCYMRAKDGDKVVSDTSRILDPGIEIPEEASQVNGITTKWIREHGSKDVAGEILDIVETLASYVAKGYVVSGFNHSFDLAILEAEHKRHWGFGLGLPEDTRYLDPCIFSRVFDKYKKGGHQLVTVARRNGVKLEENRLHTADYDVEITEQLVPIMLNRAWKELKEERKRLTPDAFITFLQDWQRVQKRKWADEMTKWFAKKGKTEEDGSPIIVEGRFPF